MTRFKSVAQMNITVNTKTSTNSNPGKWGLLNQNLNFTSEKSNKTAHNPVTEKPYFDSTIQSTTNFIVFSLTIFPEISDERVR